MLKKWMFIAVLTTTALIRPAFAEESDDCIISPSGTPSECYVMNCTLSSANVKQLEEYLNADSQTENLVILFVDFDKQVGAELADMLANNKTLKQLYFNETSLRSTELEVIAHNSQITSLGLFNNELDDAAITALENNKAISALYIGEAKVSMPAVFQFLDSHYLKSFGLVDMQITNEDFSELVQKHAHFSSLGLTGLSVSDLTPLQYLSKINRLGIHYMNIDDASAQAIGRLKQLEHLDLTKTHLSAHGANHFAELSNLQFLNIDDVNNDSPGIGDEGVRFIKQLPKLKQLFLAHQGITNVGAQIISENLNVTDLELPINRIGDEGAVALSSNPNLISIHLPNNKVRDKGAAAFGNHPSLQVLDLDNNKVGDQGGMALANGENLKYIFLNDNALTDLTAYAFAARTAELEVLYMMGNPFSKAAYEALKSNVNIRYLMASYEDDDEENLHRAQGEPKVEMEHFYKFMQMVKRF